MAINKAGFELFFRHSKEVRKKLVFNYDLTIIDKKGKEYILCHKIIPFKLDRNGNMWLGLIHAQLSSWRKTSGKASCLNTKTGDKYDYQNGEFIMSNSEVLNEEEIQILDWMLKDVTSKDMADFLDVSISTFKRKRQQIYDKLGVNSSAAAIHKAHLERII
jgi:DNA-binding CsgD family transcriptional regulator